MKKKVLILYNEVPGYRVDILELLLDEYDLTVAYTNPKFKDSSFSFKTLYTPSFKLGPFWVHSNNLHRIAKNYDVVIGLFDVRMISIMLLSMMRRRRYKLIYWGIGVTASYHNRFDSKQKMDFLRFFFGKRADALIFYTSYPVSRYINAGFREDTLFVANNTVAVNCNPENSSILKEDLLFIGTLYKEKGISILVDAYLRLFQRFSKVPALHIIGGGPMLSELTVQIEEAGMSDSILVHGPIYDKEVLASYFQKSMVCISPDQAGLSVLSSMGHGVPYLTNRNAFTGGEIFNIEDKKTGLLYEGGVEELADTLEWVLNNKDKMLEMGSDALDFYNSARRPDQMAGSIGESIEFVLNSGKQSN